MSNDTLLQQQQQQQRLIPLGGVGYMDPNLPQNLLTLTHFEFEKPRKNPKQIVKLKKNYLLHVWDHQYNQVELLGTTINSLLGTSL